MRLKTQLLNTQIRIWLFSPCLLFCQNGSEIIFCLYEQTKRHHVPKVLSIHIYPTSMPDWMQKIGKYINLYKMATFNIFQLNYQHTVDASFILSEILISHPETMEFKLLLKWKIIANVNNNLERWMPLMFSTHSRYSITKKKNQFFCFSLRKLTQTLKVSALNPCKCSCLGLLNKQSNICTYYGTTFTN